MANHSAHTLMLGGRLPYTLGEIKALRAEADEALKRAKKYISKMALADVSVVQQTLDTVWGMDCDNCA